jgi:dolichol-phosphate mannosyltransferase
MGITSGQKWSVIIFCYNEEGNINQVINKTIDVLNVISPDGCEIIIVDDGSSDKTKEIIQAAAKIHTFIKPVYHSHNMGIGKTLIDGYSHATLENVCAIPGDGQFDVNELLPFAMIPDNYIISFFRRKKTYYSFFRKILTQINRVLNYYFLGIKMRDVNWVKVYKRDGLKKISTVLTSSLVESEICAKMLVHNAHLIEVESAYLPRANGKSKGSSYKIMTQAVMDVVGLIKAIKHEREKK